MTLTVKIVTPERTMAERTADHVTVPAFDGEVGIRTGHAPFVSLLGVGHLRIKSQTEADVVMALKGGVAQIVDDELTILAESVVEVAEVSEVQLVRRLEQLNAATYEDALALAEARAEGYWLVTQLKVAGKQVPDVSRLGL